MTDQLTGFNEIKWLLQKIEFAADFLHNSIEFCGDDVREEIKEKLPVCIRLAKENIARINSSGEKILMLLNSPGDDLDLTCSKISRHKDFFFLGDSLQLLIEYVHDYHHSIISICADVDNGRVPVTGLEKIRNADFPKTQEDLSELIIRALSLPGRIERIFHYDLKPSTLEKFKDLMINE
jgi:hypothetical protein